MRPDVSELLRTTGMQIPGMVAPTAFGLGAAGLITGLLMISAGQYDRAAEIRVTDNAEMRALFAELAAGVRDAGLRAQVEAAAKTTDASIRISALNATNAELRKVLIALQSHVEETGDRAAQKRVWDVLKASAERRMLSPGMG
jgi:hypothetical protein